MITPQWRVSWHIAAFLRRHGLDAAPDARGDMGAGQPRFAGICWGVSLFILDHPNSMDCEWILSREKRTELEFPQMYDLCVSMHAIV